MRSTMRQIMMAVLIFVVLWLSAFATDAAISQQVSRPKSLQLTEEEGSRRQNRPAECTFGKTIREVGSTWFADLGPPFGVMYCIKCECIPTIKKRRIVARVQCRNIKNDCPKITCDDPIRVPGRCCKVCPGDQFDADINQDAPQLITAEEEEKNMKYYGALLTGRTSAFLKREEIKSVYSTNNPLNLVATARFTFHKRNLYYSFYVSGRAPKPRLIQFIDDGGRIMEEHQLHQPGTGPFSVYQNSTDKLCGVWRRVPRDYRKMLRDDLISVVLLWGGPHQAELALAGRISKYPALATELFSSLLEPAPDAQTELLGGAGGTAIISTSSGATASIHITFVLNGLFGPEEIADVALNIRLESAEKRQLILEDVVSVGKPVDDYNIIEFSSPLSRDNLRLLTRGKLVVVVSSRKHTGMRVQGTISTRVACEHFQALLAPPLGPAGAGKSTAATGLAWVYLNRDGNLVYNVYTDALSPSDIPMITMTDESMKRRTELEDLTPSIRGQTAVGAIDRVGPKVIEALYADSLGVNVATETDESVIRGRLVGRMVADARDSPEPILLRRPPTASDGSEPMTHVHGMAWLSVDNECTLHYEITLGGAPVSPRQSYRVFLEEIPIEAPGAPVSRRLLDDWNGYYLEGFNMDILAAELAKLETSVVYVEVRETDVSGASGRVLLRGKLKSMKIPGHCAPYTDNDVPSLYQAPAGEHNDNNQVVSAAETHCFDSKRFHKEGDQWKSEIEECTMCSCLHGLIKCEPIKCPPLLCRADERQTLKDECCASCMGTAESNATSASAGSQSDGAHNGAPRGCYMADQFHLAGTSWHPYLPPNGFDTCAVCTCDLATLNIVCPRVQCPSLPCSDKIAYRPDKKACCKVCPDIRPHSSRSHRPHTGNLTATPAAAGAAAAGGDRDEAQQDEARPSRRPATAQHRRSNDEILESGGCSVAQVIYSNGEEWHPVLPTGEQKCVTCRCKDSAVECTRRRCSRSVCNNRVQPHGKQRAGSSAAAPVGALTGHHAGQKDAAVEDECCSSHCKRSRRHQNKKRLMREYAKRQHAGSPPATTS